MKTKIICLLLAALISAAALYGCSKDTPTGDNTVVPEGFTEEEWNAYLDSLEDIEVEPPKGDVTEIWFEETFNVFYPMQLEDMYFTKAYVYGETETEQPAVCLCSEQITDIKLYTLENGALGEELFTLDELNPMEAILIQEDISETASLAVTFKDSEGAEYKYSIARNAQATEIIALPIE